MKATPSVPPSSSARPADRLGFTLLIAAVLHLALIIGVGFEMPKPSQISKSLEVTLATFQSEQAPKDADFIAQHNQEGSGSLEHKAAPKTTEQAPLQDSEIRKVTPPARRHPARRSKRASRYSLPRHRKYRKCRSSPRRLHRNRPARRHRSSTAASCRWKLPASRRS